MKIGSLDLDTKFEYLIIYKDNKQLKIFFEVKL